MTIVAFSNRWTQQGALIASDGLAFDEFGRSVAISGGVALIGAPYQGPDDDFDTGPGAAYVFAPPRESGSGYCTCPLGPCGNSDPGAGCGNSTGAGALLRAQGTAFPDEVNLLVSGAPPGQFAIFFQGDNPVSLPFGDGFRCAGANVVRITTPPIATDSLGAAAYGPCFGDPSISSVTGVVPGSGDTKRYQFWYRDPQGPCNSSFNLSNGYEITW